MKDDLGSYQVAERALKQAKAQQSLSREDYRSMVSRLSEHLDTVITSQKSHEKQEKNREQAAAEKRKQKQD